MKPWKAIYAAVLAGIATATTAVPDVTVGEWLAIAGAVVAAFGGVYFVDNKWGEDNLEDN
jgi:DNA replicative helicase MCM subunit Mcm2 (Cdc46/Mcm family)